MVSRVERKKIETLFGEAKHILSLAVSKNSSGRR